MRCSLAQPNCEAPRGERADAQMVWRRATGRGQKVERGGSGVCRVQQVPFKKKLNFFAKIDLLYLNFIPHTVILHTKCLGTWN